MASKAYNKAMCGRYTLITTKDLAGRYNLQSVPKDLRPNYNVAPGQELPVIVGESGTNQIKLMRWGLIPVWAKDQNMGYRLINARAETLLEKNTWKRPFMSQRCLVPASGFYEWRRSHKDGKPTKIPYYLHLKTDKIFSFAGLYDEWQSPEGETVQSYSIITTKPNSLVEPIHDRMPVILPPQNEADWLRHGDDDDMGFLEDLLKPYSAQVMGAYVVSSVVNNPHNNSPEVLVEPK